MRFETEFPFHFVLRELSFDFLGWASQRDFISGAPELMSSWGLKYYPLCGFDCGQVFNKRHVRKHWFGKADNFGFKAQGTKDPRTRLAWLSLLVSLCVVFPGGGGCCFWRGWRALVSIPGAFMNLFGPPVCLYSARIH